MQKAVYGFEFDLSPAINLPTLQPSLYHTYKRFDSAPPVSPSDNSNFTLMSCFDTIGNKLHFKGHTVFNVSSHSTCKRRRVV